MSGSTAAPGLGRSTTGSTPGTPDDTRAVAGAVAGLWWVSLVVGIAWIVASLVILQFDQASVTTVGVIVGIMFLVAGAQQLALAALAESLRWLWALFGVVFLVAGIICFANPEDTFAGLADVLGFLFLSVGVWWIVQAFLERDVNPGWWLGLISGPAMIALAFWTAGQLFIEQVYVLLVFAGVWAMLQGVGDIVRAFALRSVRDVL